MHVPSFLALSCNHVFGQVKISITAQPNPVPVNQQFQLDIAIENGDPTQLSRGTMDDFQVLQGPFSSSFSQNINGRAVPEALRIPMC